MLPAFSAIKEKWRELQSQPNTFPAVIQTGIDKLDNYVERVEAVPAYVLAMSKLIYYLMISNHLLIGMYSLRS